MRKVNADISGANSGGILDTTPPLTPAAPTVTNDNSSAPVLSGSTEANAVVRIYEGTSTTLLATVTASGTGAWTWTVAGQPPGAYSASVTASDAAGNTSGRSPTASYIIIGAPPPATPARPTVTNNNSPAPILSGNTVAGATVRIYDDALANVIATVVSDVGGAWTWTVSGLAVNTYSMSVTATNTGGSTSARSPSASVTVAVTPPTPLAPIVTGDGTAAPVVSGVTVPNTTVTIYHEAATVLTTVISDSSGAWSWTMTGLAVGSYDISVTAGTGATTSARSPSVTVTVAATASDTPAAASEEGGRGCGFGSGLTWLGCFLGLAGLLRFRRRADSSGSAKGM
jgi:hypothetical protein